MKKIISILKCFLLAFLVAGCAVTAEQLKKMPEEQLFYRSDPDTNWMNTGEIQSRRQEIINRHPEWPDLIKEDILNGRVRIGMTAYQAQASWGIPNDISHTATVLGSSETWIYNQGGYKYAFLCFDGNGILTSSHT